MTCDAFVFVMVISTVERRDFPTLLMTVHLVYIDDVTLCTNSWNLCSDSQLKDPR